MNATKGTKLIRRIAIVGLLRTLKKALVLGGVAFLSLSRLSHLHAAEAAPKVSSTQPLQLEGIVQAGSSLEFIIKGGANGRTAWLKVGDMFENFKVISGSAAEGFVILVNEGSQLTLRLRNYSGTNGALAELSDRGISTTDLILPLGEKLAVIFTPGMQKTPTEKRYVGVKVLSENSTVGVAGPGRSHGAMLSSSTVPAIVRDILSAAHLSQINERLKTVEEKWIAQK